MAMKDYLKDPRIQEILRKLREHRDEDDQLCDCYIDAVFTRADLCPEAEKLSKAAKKIIAEE